jgi:hypothetical protein
MRRQITDRPAFLLTLFFTFGVIVALIVALMGGRFGSEYAGGVDSEFFRAFWLMVLQIAVSSTAGPRRPELSKSQ